MSKNTCTVKNKNVSINGSFEIRLCEDGFGYIIAECKDLGTMGWGKSQKEAVEILRQRNLLLFEELLEKNELIEVLGKLNWEIIENNMGVMVISPFIVKTPYVEINQSYQN